MFVWSEKFETKIDIVDTQHKKLIELLNELYESLDTGELGEVKLDNILKQLLEYADKHFIDEEMLMLQNHVDDRHRSLHRMEHQSFIYDAKQMRTHLSPDESIIELTEKLTEFVTSWWTYHILGMDQIMASQIAAIHRGMTPEQAYETNPGAHHDVETTRLLLNAVIDMWRKATERCYKLEEELAALSENPDHNRSQ